MGKVEANGSQPIFKSLLFSSLLMNIMIPMSSKVMGLIYLLWPKQIYKRELCVYECTINFSSCICGPNSVYNMYSIWLIRSGYLYFLKMLFYYTRNDEHIIIQKDKLEASFRANRPARRRPKTTSTRPKKNLWSLW